MDAKLLANRHFEIWIDKTKRIASMHEVKGYQHMILCSEEEWIQLIDELVKTTYRFQ